MQITAADTSLTPYNTGTFGSSQTFICGNAVKLACDDLKKKMVEQLKVIYDGCTVKEKDHRYYISGGEELELSFEDARAQDPVRPQGQRAHRRGHLQGSGLPQPVLRLLCQGGIPQETQRHPPHGHHRGRGCRHAHQPPDRRGQLEGGIAQGVGYALYERMEINPRSRRTLSTDFLHYRIRRWATCRARMSTWSTATTPTARTARRASGELATVPVAPAIVNAVRRASGIEINSLPLCDKFAILPTERGNVK